jgi:hypothetical protein
MSRKTTISANGGEQADVRHLEDTESGPRLKVSYDVREWICVVDQQTGEVSIEIGRRNGSPADLETPDWLTDNLSHLASPA